MWIRAGPFVVAATAKFHYQYSLGVLAINACIMDVLMYWCTSSSAMAERSRVLDRRF